MTEAASKLEIEEVGRVTIAKIIDTSIRDEIAIQMLRNQLMHLVENEGRINLIVDFSHVHYFSSAALNLLVLLDHRVKSAGGKLCLCGLRADVQEVFEITRMSQTLQIYPDQAAALASF